MRVFEHPNTSSGWVCPVCGTDEDKAVVLVTDIAANICSGIDINLEKTVIAQQIHLDCIELDMVALPGGRRGLVMAF